MNKALMVVSFGTSDPNVIEACIAPVERALAAAFPDREPVRAFTSRFIIKKLRAAGTDILSETEAALALRDRGLTDILAVSTHLLPGIEYDRLTERLAPLVPTEPLLSRDEDLDRVAALLLRLHKEEGQPILAMGHGTEHAANDIYARLQARLPNDIIVACVEGDRSLDSVMDTVNALPSRSVTLMPLLLVAGEHAHNDLAGDSPDSWRSRLTALGFEVRCRLDGLGTYPEIQQMYISKAMTIRTAKGRFSL